MNLPRVLLISTGGTITMTAGGGNDGISPTLTGEDLVRSVPQLATRAALDVVSYSTRPGASLTLADLVAIAARIDARAAGCAGAVVVQGTDTIEETAFILDLLVAANCPVVVTGAMRGAAAPSADGPANLLGAVTVAASSAARDLGTLVVLNDEAHAARYVKKGDTALPSAFASPGAGPLGRIIEGDYIPLARVARTPPLPQPAAVDDCAVALIKVGLGDDGRLLPILHGLGYRGAVIEATGAGHLPSWFAPLVSDLTARMPVVLATRVAAGPVLTRTYGFAGSETDLIARGVMPAGLLASVKARLLLQLLLANGLEGAALSAAYRERSIGCGGTM